MPICKVPAVMFASVVAGIAKPALVALKLMDVPATLGIRETIAFPALMAPLLLVLTEAAVNEMLLFVVEMASPLGILIVPLPLVLRVTPVAPKRLLARLSDSLAPLRASCTEPAVELPVKLSVPLLSLSMILMLPAAVALSILAFVLGETVMPPVPPFNVTVGALSAPPVELTPV